MLCARPNRHACPTSVQAAQPARQTSVLSKDQLQPKYQHRYLVFVRREHTSRIMPTCKPGIRLAEKALEFSVSLGFRCAPSWLLPYNHNQDNVNVSGYQARGIRAFV